MHYWQNLGATVLLVSVAAGAQAADKTWTLQGDSLKIATSCAKTVEIRPGAAHQVTVAASAEHGEEIDQLTVNGGDVATIQLANSHCWDKGLFSRGPSLALTITVPMGAPLDIKDAGVASYTIGSLGGDLKLALAGAGNAEIGDVAAAHIQAAGAGNVSIRGVKGAFDAQMAGAGNLTVGAIDAPSAGIQARGKSAIRLGSGSIGSFSLNSAGASDVAVDATVGDADVNVAGAGEVRLAKLTGHINQSVSGAARVSVGH